LEQIKRKNGNRTDDEKAQAASQVNTMQPGAPITMQA
jgi:hypothetical protein